MAASTSNIQPDDDVLIEMNRRMLLIRKSEEQLFRDVKLGRTSGQVHLSDGQEADACVEGAVAFGDAGEVPSGEYVTPLGEARIMREGSDLSLISIGSMARMTLQAAKLLETEPGVSAEVPDLQSPVPLDTAEILASVERTGRAIVVDESRDACSVASHVAAILADGGFARLKAPVQRITVPDTAMPYAPSAELPLLPNAEQIVIAARALFPGAEEMKAELRLARIGKNMEEGTVTKWSVAAGDRFETGNVRCEVETESVSDEIGAPGDDLMVDVLVGEDAVHAVSHDACIVESA